MEYVLVLALALLIAMFTNYAGPKFYASSFGQRFQGSYAARSLATGLVIFAGIILATFVLAIAYKKPSLASIA